MPANHAIGRETGGQATMFQLPAESTDDPGFMDLVNKIVNGAVVTHRPHEVQITKIDYWFDHKWLGFSGKVVGAVGSWRKQLTIPPFVPGRIIEQRHYVRDDDRCAYKHMGHGHNVHHDGPSSGNLRRCVNQIAPNAALFWFSGDTASVGRGSLMGYIPVEEHHWPWFLAFDRDADWRVARRKGIQEYEVRMFHEAGEAQLKSESPPAPLC